MNDKMLLDEELDLVSGGVLKESWDSALFNVMRVYKGKFGDAGLQKVKDVMAKTVNDPESSITEEDLVTVYQYIEDNWDKVDPLVANSK